MFIVHPNCKCCQFFVQRSGFEMGQKLESVKDLEKFKRLTHHCEDCWNKFHHGERDKDYVPLEVKE